MAAVKNEIAHILAHVNAEAATRDLSQSPGVEERAKKVRTALAVLVADARNLSRPEFVRELVSRTKDAELKSVMSKLSESDDGQRIRLILAEWVGKNRFFKDVR